MEDTSSFWSALGSIITALVTLGLYCLASEQLNKIKEVNSADFLHRLLNDLGKNSKSIDIVRDLKKNDLMFTLVNDLAFFSTSTIPQKYDSSDFNETVLNPLELVAIYEKKGLIDISMVYETCDAYLRLVWEHETIKEYIDWVRSRPRSSDCYDAMEELYIKLINYGNAKIQ